ncbi:MAG: hypothetical protein J1F07_04955 [Muribaculaceae bacterium]|nr:hypothetical protein [Muribaculaceae bacterium]
MARPIKETPILFGTDARRFEERMKNPPKITEERKEEMIRNYEMIMKMLNSND